MRPPFRRRIAILALLSQLALGLALVSAPPAAATSHGRCDPGDMCLYNLDWYGGCRFTNPSSIPVLSSWSWANCPNHSPANAANSFENRGTVCTARLYDWNWYSGGFKWVSRQGLGGYWADGNLGNNYWGGQVGGSSGTIIENDTQSYLFC